MDDRERQYREYLALRQHEQQEEISREYEKEQGRRREGSLRDSGDDKYGQFMPGERSHVSNEGPYVPDEREQTRRISNKAKRVSAAENPSYSADGIRSRREREARDRELRDRQMQDYIAAREADRNERGVRSGIIHADYDEHGRGRKKHRPGKGPNGHRKRRIPAPLLAILIILVLLAATALGGFGVVMATVSSAQHVNLDKGNLGIDSTAAAAIDGYRNIAILGTDARADDDDAQVRSDAIIVASINEETNEVKLFSVFRDTLLDVGEQGLDKITHAYFYGGAQQSLYTLNKNLDLNIDEVVVINWKTVADVIDSVGGIEIDVQESELDELNKYIHETGVNVDGPTDKVKEPGKQTLNGVQAVTYARIRKDAVTGDYRRNERMKIVFSQTFKAVKQAGPLKMLSVARNAMPEVKTNLSSMDIVKLMAKVKSFDMTDSTTGFPYDVGSWTGYGGAGYAWYGPPINLTNNVSKLHEQFFDQKEYTPSETVQEISDNISALTGLY